MAITTPPEITPYPEAPQRNQAESVFVPLANTFVASLEPRRVEMQALADWMKVAGDTVHQELQVAADAATQQAEAARDDARLAEAGALLHSTNANNAAIRAGQSASAASGSADRADSARDAALATGKTYPTTADGLAATTDGEYFTVAGPTSYLTLYRNDSGSESLIATYPSEKTITNLESDIAEYRRTAADPILAAFIL